MQPTRTLSPDLLPNQEKFSHPFFARHPLRLAPAPLQLSTSISKHYQFPTYYGDVTCAIGIYMCDYARAAAQMPDPSMQPVRMPMGRSVVILSCYIYRNVMNVAPYNEVAMTIPVMVGPGSNPPVLPLIRNYDRKGYYVFNMPVTSLENQIRGVKFWGLPKVVEQIDVDFDDRQCTTTICDEQGRQYFALTVPTSGKPKTFDETGYLYSQRDGKLLKSQTNFLGDFNVNTRLGGLLRRSPSLNQTPSDSLQLGASSRADILRSLEIENRPFQTRFARTMNACFDLPLGSA